MCSRYNLTSPPEAVRSYFRYANDHVFPPRYNIAPGQPVAIVRNDTKGQRELALVRWGLVPGWVKDPRAFAPLINARAETASEKPSFRGPLRHRRCLVPADGFYEWSGPAGARRPHLARPRTRGPIAFAALFEPWLGADGSEIETMAILTVPANATLAPIHDRMPAILSPDAFDAWLDCRAAEITPAVALLRPAADDLLEVQEVDPILNNPRNEGVQVLKQVGQIPLL